MRSTKFVLIVQCLLLAMAGVSSAQDSRDDVVAEGVRALSNDVRKLSDDVKELVALIKSQQKTPVTESNNETAIEPTETSSQILGSEVKEDSNAHSSQSSEVDHAKWLSRIDEQLSTLNGSEVLEHQLALNADVRDISLVEAKRLAMKAYRESDSGLKNVDNEFERIRNEQNLLQRVEGQYWDLWAAYKSYDAHKKSSEAILNHWRVEVAQKGVGHECEQQIVNLWRTNQNALNATLNGPAIFPRAPGLYELERALRSTLGHSASDGAKLRPSDTPILTEINLDWSTLMETALKENVFLKQKRNPLSPAVVGKPNSQIKDELKTSELMLAHELRTCYQNKQTNYSNLNLSLDWWKANEREIEIYQERLRTKVGDRHLLLDNIARAHQRRAQAETEYYQAVREYNKALAGMKYLCSQLTVASD